MDIKLGQKVRDVITGFEGIAVSRIEYITGCTQFGVASPVDGDGKIPLAEYLDQSRLVVIDERSILEPQVVIDAPGGPQRDAPRR